MPAPSLPKLQWSVRDSKPWMPWTVQASLHDTPSDGSDGEGGSGGSAPVAEVSQPRLQQKPLLACGMECSKVMRIPAMMLRTCRSQFLVGR